MYVWTCYNAFLVIVVYIDDVLTSGNSNELLDEEVNYFKGPFEVREDSKTEKILGFFVQDEEDRVKLDHAPMLQNMLKAFKLKHFKSETTPLPHGLDIAKNNSDELTDATPFRQLAGTLLHLASTIRSDIAFSVCCLSFFMHRLTGSLWDAAKHL